MGQVARQFKPVYQRWRNDIRYFAEHGMGFNEAQGRKLSGQQLQLLDCVQMESQLPLNERKKRIAVKSGQGTGKTAVEVIIGFWRTIQAKGARTYVTAPTQHQLNGVWMTEARESLSFSHPLLRALVTNFTNKAITFGGLPNWRIEAKSTSRPENFQGLHQNRMTIIVDEASGVDREIIKTCKATVTNPDSLLLAAGNPNSRGCAFFDMFHKPSERDLWHCFTFNAVESPIVDQTNIEKLIAEFTTDSDTYRVRVLGEFPFADPNAVMSTEDLWACTGTNIFECSKMKGDHAVSKALGIDLARFGGDESTIYRRSGHSIVEWVTFSHKSPLDVLREAMKMQTRANWSNKQCVYVVDATGIGQGAIDLLHENDKRVYEFHAGGKSSDRAYDNKVTEAYFHVAKLAKARRLHLPDDEHLIFQLGSRLYQTDEKTGKLRLEKKADYIKRHTDVDATLSPDRADGLVMAYYHPVELSGRVAM